MEIISDEWKENIVFSNILLLHKFNLDRGTQYW